MAGKTVLLLERPIRRPFSEQLKGEVESYFREHEKEFPIPVTPRWHQTEPILLLESKFANLLIQFGPTDLKVTAEYTAFGKFLDNGKTRAQALGAVTKIADALAI